jgi:hypothetical protein
MSVYETDEDRLYVHFRRIRPPSLNTNQKGFSKGDVVGC